MTPVNLLQFRFVKKLAVTRCCTRLDLQIKRPPYIRLFNWKAEERVYKSECPANIWSVDLLHIRIRKRVQSYNTWNLVLECACATCLSFLILSWASEIILMSTVEVRAGRQSHIWENWTDTYNAVFIFYLFIQYFKRVTHLAKTASLPYGPLQHIIQHTTNKTYLHIYIQYKFDLLLWMLYHRLTCS